MMFNEENESLRTLLWDDEIKEKKSVSKLIVKYGTLVDILGEPFKIFTKYVKVFDLYFVATAISPDYKLLHGATVLYQYIDNNDSGVPDNKFVYEKLRQNKATMVMFRDQKELESHQEFFDAMEKRTDIMIQDLEADETRPGSILPHQFDEALEECFHLVTDAGYCLAYPMIFGLQHGSRVSLMMDFARGGYFKEIPKKYPPNAWYTYYDTTCDYSCMITEYLYWAMTTILGGQRYRHSEIKDEWRPSTRAEIKLIDNPIYSLLTDPSYKLPTKLPLPVDGIPLHVSAACKKSTCCGCFGNYTNRIKEKWINKHE